MLVMQLPKTVQSQPSAVHLLQTRHQIPFSEERHRHTEFHNRVEKKCESNDRQQPPRIAKQPRKRGAHRSHSQMKPAPSNRGLACATLFLCALRPRGNILTAEK